MKRIAVFVDAGYFWTQLGVLLGAPSATRSTVHMDHSALHARLLREVREQLPDGDLLRVYWYDTLTLSGRTADQHAIDMLDDFKLRLCPGPSLRSGSGHQGGLSSMMVADLMGLAHHRGITHALLVSGHAELAPGVLAVQAMGLRAHLLVLGDPAAVPMALAAEADLKRSWSLADIRNFASLPPERPEAASAPLEAATGVVATENASERPAEDEVSLARVAQVANTRIKDGPQSVVFAALKPGIRTLPREIDSALLAVGRQELGRALTEPEKRELRRAFQGLIWNEFDDRVRREHGHTPSLS